MLEKMVKLSIQNENEGCSGLYTELDTLNQIIEILKKSDDIEITIRYKQKGQLQSKTVQNYVEDMKENYLKK